MENATETNWYKQICVRCPYFVDAGEELGIRCERPNDQECLGESLLVQRLYVVEEMREILATTKAVLPPIKHKKIKRRR